MNIKKTIKTLTTQLIFRKLYRATHHNHRTNKMLIVCYDVIGNLVLSLPAIQQIKHEHPEKR